MKKGLILTFILLFIILSNQIFATQIFVADENNAFLTIPDDVFTEQILVRSFSTLQDSSAQNLLGRIITNDAQKTLFTIQVYNSLGNNTQQFIVSANSFVDNTISNFNNYQFNLSPNEQQAIAILSSSNNEQFEIIVRCQTGCDNSTINGYDVTFQVLDEQEKTITNSMDIFLNSITEIITYNILIWKIVFYLLVFILFIGFIGFLFGIAFMIFDYSKKIRQNRGVFGTENNKIDTEDREYSKKPKKQKNDYDGEE